MNYPTPTPRTKTLRGRRIIPPIFALLLLAVSGLLSPSLARGDFVSNTASVSALFRDDVHTSTLNPYPMIPVSSITYAGHPELNGQCTWINASLDAYKAANLGWSYDWAGVTQEAKVEAGISLVPYDVVTNNPDGTTTTTRYSGYNPFVVNQPDVKAANGNTFASRISNAEVGGAVFSIQYTKQAGVDITNLHWIQAYTGTFRGTAFGPILDNGGSAYRSQDNTALPYYAGEGYSAGTLTGGGGYFLDRPFVTETIAGGEYESNPVVSAQFQVVLADQDRPKHLELYGGEWWGYTYTAIETPEPASSLLLALGGCGLLFFRRMRGWMVAA